MDYKPGEYFTSIDMNCLRKKSEGTGIVSGLVTTPKTDSLGIFVSTGSANFGGIDSSSIFTSSEITTLSLVSDDSLPRKAIVYMDTNGDVSFTMGTISQAIPPNKIGRETQFPFPPEPPSDSVIISEIWIPAGAESGEDLTIYNENPLYNSYAALSSKITNILSDNFYVDSTGVKTITASHNLPHTPNIEDISLTIIETDPVDDWVCGYIKVHSIDNTNVVCKVNVKEAGTLGTLDGWTYYKNQIINSSSDVGTNYQKKIKVHYGVLNWNSFTQSINFERDLNNPLFFAEGGWEGTANLGCECIIEELDHLKMYYTAYTVGPTGAKVGLATSSKTYPPTNFTKYAGNPVYEDGVFVALGNVIKVGSVYYMYYQYGVAGAYFALATSGDGITFTRYGNVLTTSADETVIQNVAVISKDASTWYMYYSYRTATKTLPGFRIATSSNGINWTKISGDVLTTGSAGTFDSTYLEHHHITYAYNTYILTYEAYNGTNFAHGIAYNTSTVPTGTFTKYENNPIFERSGVTGSWDQHHVATPHLFNHGDNWYLFFQGGASISYGDSNWGLAVAYNTENIYMDSKCKTDFGDIRFCQDNGPTLLDYWMETKSDSNNALFWVKIPDDLGSNSQTISVFYGNATATSIANGTSTFEFFDDFTGTTLDAHWVSNQFVTVSDGIATFSTGTDAMAGTESYALTTQTFEKGKSAEICFRAIATTSQSRMGWTVNRTFMSSGSWDICGAQFYGYMYGETNDGSAITSSHMNYGTYTTSSQNLSIKWIDGISGSNALFYKDRRRLWGANDIRVPTASDMKLYLRDKMNVDWIFVRNSANLEPNGFEFSSESDISGGLTAKLGIKINAG
jgi:predicted GH43/DUF377 family glycosyl hydrolase